MEGRREEEGEGGGRASVQDELARLSAKLVVRDRTSLLCGENRERKPQSLGPEQEDGIPPFPYLHPTGDTCLREFLNSDYFIGPQF